MSVKTPTENRRHCAAFVAFATTVLVLGGCASSEGLAPQGRMATPAAEKSLSASAGHVGTWPAADWWHALGDAQLDGLIDEAVQGNPDLAAVDARMRLASAAATAADAQRSLKVAAMATVQGVRLPAKMLSPESTGGYITPKVVGLNGSYSFDLWGGERATWQAALGQQRASEVDAQAARLAISADVARVYTRLGHAWLTNDLIQKDVDRTQHLLALTKQRVDAGIDSIAQLHGAEALAASARQQLAQSAHEIESERIALAVLVGKGPDRAVEIARPAVLQPMAVALPDNLPADLLGRRPDIVAARWRVEAARHGIDAAQASFYPSFNLTAAIGLVSFHADELLSLPNRYYFVAPAVSLPIFNSRRLRANLASRDTEYDIAVAQYNKSLVGALNEVALQIQATQSLTTQEAAQRQSVDAALEAWNMAMQRYRSGVGSYVEALNTEQMVLAAQATLADIHARQIDTAIQLVRALGGGYEADSQSKNGATPPAKQDNTNKASS